MTTFKHYLSHSIGLLFSITTLLCCALPVLLVMLGFDTAVATLVSAFPALITLTQYKHWLFLALLLSILMNGYLVYVRTPTPCPITINGSASEHTACAVTRVWNKKILWLSILLFLFGFFMAYRAQPLLQLF